MYIVHCPYPPRQVKKLIHQLISGGASRVSKINYAKSYIPNNKKTQTIKECILYIYVPEDKRSSIDTFLQKNMADCSISFMIENQ